MFKTMKKIAKKDLERLIIGSSILGTGGGGSIASARILLGKMRKQVKLISLQELQDNDVVVTVFGVGGKENCDPIKASQTAFGTFQRIFKTNIKAIIPVEIGPLATLSAATIASELRIPLLDADIVGFRSSPEVFIETITLANLSREPSVIANDVGDVLILYSSSSLAKTEKILRNFAVTSGGDAFVVGYPLPAKKIRKVVGITSVSFTILLGKDIEMLQNGQVSQRELLENNSFVFLGEGTIISENKVVDQGFTKGSYVIKTNY